ncbi:hypothetical protein A5780_14435 [Nocardia sp. 852002-20019_SCH5090214]|uniref:hypothetical protein n=1 Tax=Nocardia sp. 852002-20019_SCH5090214 TaxID=1834087 RepID=UPI0007EB0EF7|nr:hypothetical protein [Nocardia sp. 852002-20019_SCH5090214]OBA66292.1 hypothetical protein A5780_14435 [Nocardia sp. 852002-20019_SCH5090214]
MGRSISNHYEWWTDERYVELTDLLRTDLTVSEIAERTGRSTTAIQAQLKRLLPPDYKLAARKAEKLVRDLLRSGDFDWRQPLREHEARANRIYWDPDMNDTLRYGWEQAQPLQELTEALGASELEVARQLMRLGLAENSRETAERLGCDPAGTLAGRLRLAEDRAAAAVWVLVVDNARGTAAIPTGVAEPEKRRRHISVHLDFDTADLALGDILRAHVEDGGDPGEVTASIVERSVGDLAVGAAPDLAGTVASVPRPGLVDLDGTDEAAGPARSSVDDRFAQAVDELRRERESQEQLERAEQRQRQSVAQEFAEQAQPILTEAVERIRQYEGLELLIVRPKKRKFERAGRLFGADRGEPQPRYEVIDRQRCWLLPSWVTHGSTTMLYGSMLLTERAELVHLDAGTRIAVCEQPRTVAIAQPPRPVDIREHFSDFGAVPGRGDVSPLDVLRTYLASCCVEHEHAPLLPPDLSESEN